LELTILVCGLALLCAWPAPASPQDQQPSLAEAARRAREQRKHAPKAARVWTNDNLPTAPGAAVSVVGLVAEPEAPEEAPAAGPLAKAATGEEKDKERKEAEAALARAKEQLKNAQKELDLLQRDFNLQRQQYYPNPTYASDTAGKERLDTLRGQINAKQQEVQQTTEKIAALEEQLEDLKQSTGTTKQPPPEE
jgi:uncharacterized coiled-coil protein SlyX